jgi:AcrR family transcriptional regulator
VDIVNPYGVIFPLSYTRGMTEAPPPLRKDAERNRQRILQAARELFAEQGLGITLNDIAHQAGCGVGTVYRRFPDKEDLIDALFEERVDELAALAKDGLAQADAWQGLTIFLEGIFEALSRDRGLQDVLLSNDQGRARITAARERLLPLAGRITERAHETGSLRNDVADQDMPLIQFMLSTVIDAARDIEPELWRRYLALILRGMRADPTEVAPLPLDPLNDDQLDDVMRTWQPPVRRPRNTPDPRRTLGEAEGSPLPATR